MDRLFTWEILGTYAGVTAATVIVVQGLKDFTRRFLRTRALVYLVAWLLMLAVDIFTPPPVDASSLALDLINAFGVGLTALGVWHQVISRIEQWRTATFPDKVAENDRPPPV